MKRREEGESRMSYFCWQLEKCYLGGVSLQRAMHLSSWQLAGGGSARGRSKRKSESGVDVGYVWGVVVEYDEGACAAGESSKVQTCLMDSPPLCDCSSEN